MKTHYGNKHAEVLLLKEYLVETLMETQLYILTLTLQLQIQMLVLLNVMSKEIIVNGTLMTQIILHLSVFFTREHVLLEQKADRKSVV